MSDPDEARRFSGRVTGGRSDARMGDQSLLMKPATRRQVLRRGSVALASFVLGGTAAGCDNASSAPGASSVGPSGATALPSRPSPQPSPAGKPSAIPATGERTDGEVLSDGLRIHYVVEGTGPPVVLLHGMGSSYQANWVATGWTALLTGAGYQVIGIDARGSGQSQQVTDVALYRDGPCVRDITAVLDAIAVRQAHFVGYSMGSGHALRLALVSPHRLRSLVLGGTGGGALAFAGLRLEDEAKERDYLLRWKALTVGLLGARDDYARRSAEAYADALLQDSLVWGNLEGLSVPTLILAAEDDTLEGDFSGFVVSQMIARRIPNARRIVVPGAGHLGAYLSQTFKDETLRFLKASDR